METVTLKLERRHVEKLREHAMTSGRSQAAVIRDLIDRHLVQPTSSLHDRAKDLCGSIRAARNLSTKRPDGYGRD